jgi:hypothetical protein
VARILWASCVLFAVVGCSPTLAPEPRATLPRPAARQPAPARLQLAAAALATLDAATGQPPDLYLRCHDPAGCELAVGMLVFPGEPLPERCTATLIGPDQILTASHCLAQGARSAGASCAGAWMAFPSRSPERASEIEWIACKRVLEVSVAPDGSALHQEFARLQLAGPSTRAPLELDARPLAEHSIVRVISVTPHPVYPRTLGLESRLCLSVSSQPAVAALGLEADRVGWLASCPIYAGNSGSPVLDRDGRVRAIVHGGTWTGFEMGVTSSVAAFSPAPASGAASAAGAR